jgi:hypothetical protein
MVMFDHVFQVFSYEWRRRLRRRPGDHETSLRIGTRVLIYTISFPGLLIKVEESEHPAIPPLSCQVDEIKPEAHVSGE